MINFWQECSIEMDVDGIDQETVSLIPLNFTMRSELEKSGNLGTRFLVHFGQNSESKPEFGK